MSGRRRSAVLAVLLLATAGCGVVHRPAAPLVRRLAAAPQPAGAVRLSEEHRDGDVERGPSAALELVAPGPPELACPELLEGYRRAGYRLYDFAEQPSPLPDPAGYCRSELATPAPGSDRPDATVICYPPGVHPGQPTDGFAVTVAAARPADPYPQGSRIRLDAS